MSEARFSWRAAAAALALSAPAIANGDWLAADPGTPINLQLNQDGALIVRPIGGGWAHPVCPDVTAAELPPPSANNRYPAPLSYRQLARDLLIAAATSGSVVNILAEADVCDEHGHPIIRNIRVQGS
jgi:hypothetical protein